MDPRLECDAMMTRRQFFGRSRIGLGAAALSMLLGSGSAHAARANPGVLSGLHHAPKAKRVIFLFQSGGPSTIDLFDYKPGLRKVHGEELPGTVRMNQRLTGMTSGQDAFPVLSSEYRFQQYGESGMWVSELMPHTAKIVDDLCMIKTANTEAINHDPAITFCQTGGQQPGRPSMGAWLSYGLGSENQDLPAFIVLLSKGSAERDQQALFQRLWGSGFLPSEHQGVSFQSGADPVLYLSNPDGIDDPSRRRMLDRLAQLNQQHYQEFHDPEIVARISQYEMAYRMQQSVPDLVDISDEPEHILDMYGPDVHRPGSYASNCLLARRLAERDVRFIQLYHRGWDQHGDLPRDLSLQCKDTDQPSAALVRDLKQRGLLDDTLVIWGGEFGRTVYCQGPMNPETYGRDHHGRCFALWMAGGGVKAGFTYGETDDYCYNIVRDPVHIHDLQATILHLLGIDHERLTYRFQGRDFRLTDVHGTPVYDIMA